MIYCGCFCCSFYRRTEYFFKFDDKFELNDHVTVLQRMGLLMGLDTGTSTERDIEQLKQLVPAEFQGLIEGECAALVFLVSIL